MGGEGADEIVFLEPVRVGDLVHAYAQVNWTGSTSMEIGVKLAAERWDEVGPEPLPVAPAALCVYPEHVTTVRET